jgi:hypothetical protein
MDTAKYIRYGTPSGNLWIGKEGDRYVVADSKVDASKQLTERDTKLTDIVAAVTGKYQSTGKAPMLVVGSHNWVRNLTPFATLQVYDLHVLFYPNAHPAWVCGVVAVHRTKGESEPVWSHGCNQNITLALKQALGGITAQTFETEQADTKAKLNVWLTNWIYRCPKISLKDVLHLEDYKVDLSSVELPKVEVVNKPRLFTVIKGDK